jgi:hypothetical protein
LGSVAEPNYTKTQTTPAWRVWVFVFLGLIPPDNRPTLTPRAHRIRSPVLAKEHGEIHLITSYESDFRQLRGLRDDLLPHYGDWRGPERF